MGDKKFTFRPTIVDPSHDTLETAKRLAKSSLDQTVRDVAKAVVDATKIGRKTMKVLTVGIVEDFDLGDYFDFWPGDAAESAETLKTSEDRDVRLVAEMLLNQLEAMAVSKQDFLLEQKRLGLGPKPPKPHK